MKKLFGKGVEYLRLIRFSHTLFALPFALLGAAMAIGLNLQEQPPVWPRGADWIGVLFCMVFARSTAMAFNRLADWKIDALNPRTAGRHLPSGRLDSRSVLVFTGICAVGFILSTLLFLPNTIPLVFSVPVLLFLCGYSYAKRFTVLVHLWLGAALGLSPVAAWVVFRPEIWPLPYPPILLGLAVMFWTTGFDIIYACQDADFDFQHLLYSLPGHWGTIAALRFVAFFHGAMLAVLFCIPLVYKEFGLIWQIGVGVVGIVVLAQHWIVRPPDLILDPLHFFAKKCFGAPSYQPYDPGIDLTRINIAFFHLNVLVSVGLLLSGLLDLWI